MLLAFPLARRTIPGFLAAFLARPPPWERGPFSACLRAFRFSVRARHYARRGFYPLPSMFPRLLPGVRSHAPGFTGSHDGGTGL